MSRVFGVCRALMSAAKAKEASASAPAKKASSGGILKPVPVSPVMRRFVGVPEISRSEAVKKVWDHIKAHGLQNPENKREIRCDEKLKSIFDGKDKVGMMEIARLLSAHFLKSPN
ncbi:upstream activation factor subunit spp27-like [Ananas comosus]|uniref:Upstream activation factor subunit spp27-like n=1 Tax=Ananas comosus TaxID=4615 RepID=A0A6P5H4M8_ANACO|nr:upstream activation factor subunit spp27-like [Ananas comosus]